MNKYKTEMYQSAFIRSVLLVLAAACFAVGTANAQTSEESRLSPNEIATVMFSVSDDLDALEKYTIELTFWEEICKECAETGLITSDTVFYDVQGELVDMSNLKKDAILEAVAILFVSSSSRQIESVYLSE